jgi:hypothetical protein
LDQQFSTSTNYNYQNRGYNYSCNHCNKLWKDLAMKGKEDESGLSLSLYKWTISGSCRIWGVQGNWTVSIEHGGSEGYVDGSNPHDNILEAGSGLQSNQSKIFSKFNFHYVLNLNF